MRTTQLAVVVALAVLGGAMTVGAVSVMAQGVALPGRVPNEKHPDAYLWLSTREMFDSSGRLRVEDPNVLPTAWRHPDVLRTYNRIYEAQRSGEEPIACIPFAMIETPIPGSQRRFGDFYELASEARMLIRGTVVNKEGGFFNGIYPGVMLQISVTERRSRNPGSNEPATMFVFYPAGEVEFGVTSICPSHETYWPPDPPLGTDILVLARPDNPPAHTSLPILKLLNTGYEVFYQGEDRVLAPLSVSGLGGVQGQREIQGLWNRAAAAFGRGRGDREVTGQ